MGIFINPGNAGFTSVRAGRYVDKSGLAAVINATLDTADKLTVISRPRRFGKSFAAKMLCAYYDRSCDSAHLFDDLSIASDPGYADHLNRYNVIYIDMTQVKEDAAGEGVVPYLKRKLLAEARELFPQAQRDDALTSTLVHVAETTGAKFVMIVDEWDAPLRETPQQFNSYIEFLRMLFKSSGTTDRIFAGAYMTGILPIKKVKGQSALSDFIEYSILKPGPFAPYTGFLEDEVRAVSARAGLDFEEMRRWYDGYSLGGRTSVYNPYAVMCAVRSGEYGSYWRKTSEVNALLTYVDLDFDGLQQDVVRLMAGERLRVDTTNFANDIVGMADRDDALTLMVHLGYLTYEDENYGVGRVRIPNQEIRTEFEKMLRRAHHPELVKLVRASDQLLADTIALDNDAVARGIALVHDSNYAPVFYNNEQALRHTVKMAYISAVDHYLRVEELPTGHGIADLVFLPYRDSALPAMVVELKWGGDPGGAVGQIRDRDYAALPADLVGDVLLVGVSYDRATKEHCCCIERAEVVR